MSQTDKKTDKATWWSITAFSQIEIDQLNGSQYPDWVFKVYGGMESCPETGRLHFQGAIQARRQVRFSQVKQWLGSAHIEPARDKTALRRYVMKEETAVGIKKEVQNETPYFRAHELLRKIAIKARQADRQTKEGWITINAKTPAKASYWWCVKQILADDATLISAYMNPALEKAWVGTSEYWISESVEGALVLQPPVISSDISINGLQEEDAQDQTSFPA